MWQNVFEQTGLLRKYISIIAKYKLKKKHALQKFQFVDGKNFLLKSVVTC